MNSKKSYGQIFLIGCLLGLCFFKSKAAINYSFSASSGSFTALSSPINIWVSGDDVTVNNIPIGFSFNFGGGVNTTVMTEVSVNSNGWIALGSNFLPNYTSYATNNLKTTSIGPIIAPLWDDLAIASGGKVNYQTMGVPGNQIFTVEWLNMKWYWGASSAVISFQVKLYEATGDIEFIYRPEVGNVNSGSASIGIGNMSSTDFYSLDNTSSSPIANYGNETNTINVKPANGQVYKWSPAVATSIISYTSEIKEINVFPNPFKNEITISEKLNAGDRIIIADAAGKSVYEESVINDKGSFKIHLAVIPKGVYYLILIGGNGFVTTKKIIREGSN